LGLAVKHPYALALNARLPTVLRMPLDSSVTLWEETAPVKLPTKHCPSSGFTDSRLGGSWRKGGISTSAPPWPGPGDQRLPPILRMRHKTPVPGYSKGSWGLSVLPRERGIFTASVISPSLSLRHCTSDYAIHARRNLPDKELRYLRTVIVTAALHGGLGCQLRLAANRLP
jgi:hypothetical protein